MKYVSALVVLLFGFNAYSFFSEQSMYVRKLEDKSNGSMLLMACKDERSCRVIGDGSLSREESLKLMAELEKMSLQDDAIMVTTLTIAAAINPVALMGFISLPVAGAVFIGTSAYCVFTDDIFEKQMKLVDSTSAQNLTSEKTVELLEKAIRQILLEIKKQKSQ